MRNATLAQLVREADLSVEERNPAWPADRGDKWRWRSLSPELTAYVEAHVALLRYAGQLPQAGGPMLKPLREACYKSVAALRDALEVKP